MHTGNILLKFTSDSYAKVLVYFQEWEAFICSMPTTSTSPTWTQNTQLWMANCQSSVIYMPWTSAIRRTLKKQLRQGLKVIMVSGQDHFNASRNLCNLKMLMLGNWGGCCCPLICAVGLWYQWWFHIVFSQLGLSLTFYTLHNLITNALFLKVTWHTFIGCINSNMIKYFKALIIFMNCIWGGNKYSFSISLLKRGQYFFYQGNKNLNA